MNTTEPTMTQEAPAKRKPGRKRRVAAAAAPKPERPDVLAGITARDCCSGCTEGRCVITGAPFCGHPFKSSHPGASSEVKQRIADAKVRLAHQKIDAMGA